MWKVQDDVAFLLPQFSGQVCLLALHCYWRCLSRWSDSFPLWDVELLYLPVILRVEGLLSLVLVHGVRFNPANGVKVGKGHWKEMDFWRKTAKVRAEYGWKRFFNVVRSIRIGISLRRFRFSFNCLIFSSSLSRLWSSFSTQSLSFLFLETLFFQDLRSSSKSLFSLANASLFSVSSLLSLFDTKFLFLVQQSQCPSQWFWRSNFHLLLEAEDFA